MRPVPDSCGDDSGDGGHHVQVVAPAETGMDIRIGTWFLVLVIAALSEAFRQGAEMRAEQELTI